MKLLAIGGPKHGELLPYSEGQRELMVPVPPNWREWTAHYDDTFYGRSPSAWDLPTIRRAVYQRRSIADRVVWVYVGE